MIGPNVERYDMLAREYPEVAARIGSVRVGELPFAGDNGIRFQPDGDDAVEYVSDNYVPVEMAPSRAVV